MITLTPMPMSGTGSMLGASSNKTWVQAIKDKLTPIVQGIQHQVINPTEQKTGVLVLHVSAAAIQNTMSAACHSNPSAPPDDVGEFLSVTRCWLEEAFGMWIAFEQVGLQTQSIGKSLQKAANSALSSDNPSTRSLGSLLDTIGKSDQVLGGLMIDRGHYQQQTIRAMRRLAPDLRDLVLEFNNALDNGVINPSDPVVAQFKADLMQLVTGWRRMVVQQIDLAIFSTKTAADVQYLNQRFLLTQFRLALVVPELLTLSKQTMEALHKLISTLDSYAMPGEALAALEKGGTSAIRDTLNAIREPATKALTTTAYLVLGIGAAAVAGLVILKKTGVIDKFTLHR